MALNLSYKLSSIHVYKSTLHHSCLHINSHPLMSHGYNGDEGVGLSLVLAILLHNTRERHSELPLDIHPLLSGSDAQRFVWTINPTFITLVSEWFATVIIFMMYSRLGYTCHLSVILTRSINLIIILVNIGQ